MSERVIPVIDQRNLRATVPAQPVPATGLLGLAALTLVGALLKNEQDVALFEKLAFMARRDR